MDMSNVKKVYNYGGDYRVFILYNNTFQSVTPFNQIILESKNYKECADFIKLNKKINKNLY